MAKFHKYTVIQHNSHGLPWPGKGLIICQEWKMWPEYSKRGRDESMNDDDDTEKGRCCTI